MEKNWDELGSCQRRRSGQKSDCFAVLLMVMVLTTTAVQLFHWKGCTNNVLEAKPEPLVKPSNLENDTIRQHQQEEDYEELFLRVAKSSPIVSDKVTLHTYQIMYGQFLIPYYKKHPRMKMLEIGLGCRVYAAGPLASVHIWRTLFPQADLWEAERNAKCVEAQRAKGNLEGFRTLVGDQGNTTVLDQWIQQANAKREPFDVIIDDGGHRNCQIWTSFLKLWPVLKSGGLYFIEDMQVARSKEFREASSELCSTDLVVPDMLKETLDDLIFQHYRTDIKFMFCQGEACLLGKK